MNLISRAARGVRGAVGGLRRAASRRGGGSGG
jgi:hypothetical protein